MTEAITVLLLYFCVGVALSAFAFYMASRFRGVLRKVWLLAGVLALGVMVTSLVALTVLLFCLATCC